MENDAQNTKYADNPAIFLDCMRGQDRERLNMTQHSQMDDRPLQVLKPSNLDKFKTGPGCGLNPLDVPKESSVEMESPWQRQKKGHLET